VSPLFLSPFSSPWRVLMLVLIPLELELEMGQEQGQALQRWELTLLRNRLLSTPLSLTQIASLKRQ
jgi:hypothetical protein